MFLSIFSLCFSLSSFSSYEAFEVFFPSLELFFFWFGGTAYPMEKSLKDVISTFSFNLLYSHLSFFAFLEVSLLLVVPALDVVFVALSDAWLSSTGF